MENIHIKRSPDSPDKPEVRFNAESGICEIIGESYMESTYTFFLPLMNWLTKYINEVNKELEFRVKLFYFNTSATKCLLDIFEILKKYEEDGGNVTVKWFYDENDPDVEDEVKDFENESGLDIQLVKI